MAIPTAPTGLSIASEGLKKAGFGTPPTTLLARAQSEWFEEIKNDILVLAGGKKLKSLQTTSIATTTNGIERYSCPSDFFADMTMEVLDGNTRDTATGGASGSITLAKDEGDIATKYVLITAGTGAGSMSQISTFDISTLVATVVPDFTTAPTAGSSYMIIDTIYQLDEKPLWSLKNTQERGLPKRFYPMGDSLYGEFILDPVPYNTDGHVFGLRMRYYANLMTLDLAGTLMATLYQNWRNVWTQGIFAKALQHSDDSKQTAETSNYYTMMKALVMRETYGSDLSNLTSYVSDY